MSHEPYPKTERTAPGSTPAQDGASNVELERQRAEGDLPGHRTRDAFREPPEDDEDEDAGDEDEEIQGVAAGESVPDDVAERAAASEDPLASGPGRDVPHEDPMHRRSSSSGPEGAPRGEQ